MAVENFGTGTRKFARANFALAPARRISALPVGPQAVFLDLVTQSLAVDPQDAGGFLAPALGAAQDELNVAFFQLLQGVVFVGEGLEITLTLGNETGQMFRLDDGPIFQDHDAFNGVFQFPDIARPAIVYEQFQGLAGGPGNFPVAFLTVLAEKVIHQQGNIPGALPQGG